VTVADVTVWDAAEDEPLGTKPKQWLRDPDGQLWLWKERTWQSDGRGGRFPKGDDWSEVVAGRLGEALGIPVARVELAVRGGTAGVVSRSVLADEHESLVHGNELLGEAGIGTGDPRDRTGYTVDAVRQVLSGVSAPEASADLPDAFSWFVGYLLLDALVGNTDRHQDNWAVLRTGSAPARLAPSFDHASCLGFLLSDAERTERLTTRDGMRQVGAFAGAAKSKFDGRPGVLDVARDALASLRADGQAHWTGVVTGAPSLDPLLDALPADRISDASREFASAVYRNNLSSLSHHLRTMGA